MSTSEGKKAIRWRTLIWIKDLCYVETPSFEMTVTQNSPLRDTWNANQTRDISHLYRLKGINDKKAK